MHRIVFKLLNLFRFKRKSGKCSECKHKSDWESCLKTDMSIHHSYINYGDDCGMWETKKELDYNK